MYILETFIHTSNNFFVIQFLYIVYSILLLYIDIKFFDYYIYHKVIVLYTSRFFLLFS